jgi:hypothetical protein
MLLIYRSNIIDGLQHRYGKDCGVVYAYIDYKIPATQCVRNILASLVKQLYRNLDPVPKELSICLQELEQKVRSHQIDSQDYVNLILRCAKHFSSVYILFDALDECDPGARWKLLSSIKDLHKGVKILITCRDHIRLDMFTSNLSLEIKAHCSDLESYIRSKLDSGHIRMADDLKDEIVKRLLSKADET